MTNEAIKPYLANLPGYANMVGKRSENTASMLAGQLPQDVIGQIGQQAAERGVGSGNPGSPNANAAYLRALGLTSLDLQSQGSQQLSQSIADTPTPELFSPASLYVPSYLGNQQLQATQAAQRQASQDALRKAQSAAWNNQFNNSSPRVFNI